MQSCYKQKLIVKQVSLTGVEHRKGNLTENKIGEYYEQNAAKILDYIVLPRSKLW